MKVDYAVGLDLGQAQDYTALAVIERVWQQGVPAEFSLRHLERFPLGTSYPAIVEAVRETMQAEALVKKPVVVDYTGIGRAVVDMLRKAPVPRLVPVTITAGQKVTVEEDGLHKCYHVPKKELVTCVQLLLQQRRLRISRAMPHADLLVKELENFRVKITLAANETFGVWRDGLHDDLVLALSLGCWWLERNKVGDAGRINGGESWVAREMKKAFPGEPGPFG